jgi:16S rRNA (guanine966-N2)-methyltransferase
MQLRIISGEFKGRVIKSPNSKFTRPTTDRVRETLFNILNNKIDFDGIQVLDLYSGSGALGLECLSRGAAHVTFIEKNRPVYLNLLGNVDLLKVKEFVDIIPTTSVFYTRKNLNKKYDLILADPPFFEYDIYEVVQNVFKNELLNEDGIMVIERSIQTREKDIENIGIEPQKKIGDALLYFFDSLL